MPYPATTNAGLVLPEPGLENLDVATFNKNMQAIDAKLAPAQSAASWQGINSHYAFDRRLITANNTGPNFMGSPSGTVYFTYFTAEAALALTTMTYYCGSVAIVGPTLIRYGLYTVAANGDLTLVASTPSDTTLLTATTTSYPKAFSAGYTLVPGQRYAGALITVQNTTAPSLLGGMITSGTNGTASIDSIVSDKWRIHGISAALADLPSTYTEANIATATNATHIRDYVFFRLS